MEIGDVVELDTFRWISTDMQRQPIRYKVVVTAIGDDPQFDFSGSLLHPLQTKVARYRKDERILCMFEDVVMKQDVI